jgi:hypothetical protein
MRSQTVTKLLGGRINLMVNYVATTWHVNAVLAPQSPHESTAELLNTPQLILRSQLFFSSKLPALLKQIVCTFREALKTPKTFSLSMPRRHVG